MLNKISQKEFIEFNRVFSLLLISRLPIITALELITRQTKNENFKAIIKKITIDVKSGSSLSKSFSKYPEIFSEIYLANLRVAEETGNIAEVLTEYTDYQEKFYNLKKKITQAARYPLFVIVVSFGVIFFMMFFLIPTFEALFNSVKAGLPPLTAFLLGLSQAVVDNGIYIFLGFAVLMLMVNSALKNENFKENVIDRLVLRLPYVSNLFIKNLLARFSLSMGILLKSKVSLLEALKISRNISTNSVFKKEISEITKKLVKGESFSNNIQNSKFFDVTFSKLLAAGEESAELDKVFYLISDYYTSEFDHKIDNMTTMIEPFLILFVGSIVAIILIAMYLPMFEIINYVGV